MTEFIATADLVWQRAQVPFTMDKLANIIELVDQDDGIGGISQVETAVGTNVRCRVAIATHRPPTELLVEGRSAPRTESYFTIKFPYGTTITAKCVIDIGSDRYQVIGVQDKRTWDTDTRVTAARIT